MGVYMKRRFGKSVLAPETPAGYGFAFHNRTTTGGDGAQLAQVYTASDYIAAIAVVDARSIQLMNNISYDGGNGTNTIKYGESNKTIWSADGRTLSGICTRFMNKENIKIKNIKVKDVGYDGDAFYMDNTRGIFFDHVEMGSTEEYWVGTPPAEGTKEDRDGLFDFNNCSGVTVANSIFSIHDKMMLLIGPVSGGIRSEITMYGNYINNIVQRSPNLRNVDAHLFNNYWITSRGGIQIGLAGNSKALIEGNYFKNLSKIVGFTLTDNTATLDARFDTDNVFDNSPSKYDLSSGNPIVYGTYNAPYEYTVMDKNSVPAYVLANAGAILTL